MYFASCGARIGGLRACFLVPTDKEEFRMNCRFLKSYSGRFVASFLFLCMVLGGIVSLPQVARATGE